jgi:hypothetical protein
MQTMVGDVVGSPKTNDAAGLSAPSSDATPVQGKEEEGVGSGPWQQQRTGAPRTALLLGSRLPRRFLAAAAGVVEESGTDGAGPSCHSHDVHVNCPPLSSAGKRPKLEASSAWFLYSLSGLCKVSLKYFLCL